MKKEVIVNDKTQKNYKYFLTEPIGKNFDREFTPDLTPQAMLELGVFSGKYLNDCKAEYPKDWFINAKLSNTGDEKLNFFGIRASLPISVWQKKKWIYKEDPRGWFQWYCRYYMGRRKPDEDERQIKRWNAIKRHIAQIRKNCIKEDLNCRIRQRQAVMHRGYDSRKI